MKVIDIRSDTVTQPTQRMRDEMYKAVVGDDIFGDDPTVARLEKLAAEMVGKEAALYMPSGTMGNQAAIMTHTRRGDEVILGETCHIVVHEAGSAALLSGVQLRTIKSPDSIIYPEALERAIRPDDLHMPPTGLICLENALAVGQVVPLDVMKADYEVAKGHGIPLHLDGARLFNAAAALGCEARDIAQYCDSVMFCLSKGLCAPVGSMLAGTREFVERARKTRKRLGGALRQSGFLAAAGIVALEDMVDRLKEDHENAKYLAEKLGEIDGVSVDKKLVQIDMVFFALDRPQAVIDTLPQKMLEKGIKTTPIEDGLFRYVTNHDVTRADLEYVIKCFADIVG